MSQASNVAHSSLASSTQQALYREQDFTPLNELLIVFFPISLRFPLSGPHESLHHYLSPSDPLYSTQQEKEKAELENKVDKLTRISDNLKETIAKLEGVEVPQLAQRFRTELMALGWYPIEELDTRTLLALAGLKWISSR
jgi:hypothetical protein